jgi:hypothetical protein
LAFETSYQNKFSVVLYFTGHKCTDESAKDKVYQNFKDIILHVLLENYDAYILQLRLKGKSHESEVKEYIDVLRRLVQFGLSDLRKTQPFADKIIPVLLNLLHTHNKLSIRQEAFQNILLELLLRAPHDDDLLNLLPYAIDLSVFSDSVPISHGIDTKDTIPLVPKETDTQPLNAQIQDETIIFMKTFLQLFTKVPEQFEHWFAVFKKYFMVSLYPKVSKEIGLSNNADNIGFNKCPTRIQEVIVEQISECMLDKPEQRQHLWSDTTGNSRLMLEVYRQGLLVDLKPTYQKTLLDSFWKALFKEPVEIPADRLKSHRKFFIDPLPIIIRGEKSEMVLLLEIQLIFKRSVHDVEVWSKLDEDMRLLLLTSCLKLATNLLKGNANIGADTVVVTVLDIWVHAQVMNKTYWETLRNELGRILDRKEVVEHIQAKLLQVTNFMCKKYYFSWDKYNRNIDRILKCAKHSGYSRTPDGRKFELKKSDPLMGIEQWDVDKTTTIWNFLLDIF